MTPRCLCSQAPSLVMFLLSGTDPSGSLSFLLLARSDALFIFILVRSDVSLGAPLLGRNPDRASHFRSLFRGRSFFPVMLFFSADPVLVYGLFTYFVRRTSSIPCQGRPPQEPVSPLVTTLFPRSGFAPSVLPGRGEH